MAERNRFEGLGPNVGLVEELYRQFLEDPESVGEGWRAYFADYVPLGTSPAGERERAAAGAAPAPAPLREAPAPAAEETEEIEPLRGGAVRQVENMEASLGVPTATSVRTIPAKLLEVNRSILNNQLARTGRGKVSFTHIIGFAVTRSLARVPAMNASFSAESGKPGIVRHRAVNLGLAVDVQKRGGSRTLLVPNVKGADTLDFAGFVAAYEEAIRRVRAGEARAQGLRRHDCDPHQPGHDRHRALGAAPDARPGRDRRRRRHREPAGLRGRGPGDPRAPRRRQDHHPHQHLRPPHHPGRRERRVPGLRSTRLLLGEDGFYDEIFRSLSVPYEPARWVQRPEPGGGRASRPTRSPWPCTSSSTSTACAAT